MEFTVTILSSGSGSPGRVRLNQSAQHIRMFKQRFLVDCGEGTQQLIVNQHLSYNKIDRIFISHLHADHFGGLFSLINTMNLNHRHSQLDIYGPEALKKILDVQLEAGQVKLRFALEFHPILPGFSGLLFEDDRVKITAFPLLHRIPTSGFSFTEKCSKFKINKDAIAGKDIPREAFKFFVEGRDYPLGNGTILSRKEYTLPPAKARKYVYITDTSPCDPGNGILKDTDVLYHEATFGSKHEDKTLVTGHSSAADAAKLAQKYQVKQLVIGHFSTRYSDLDDIESEAIEIFPNTSLARPGLRLHLLR